jgi:hypothetical protein
MRFDLYTAIHKTQRFHLGRLAERIGRADASDPETWLTLSAEVRAWLGHLRDHAHHEHELIHPLYARCGDSATQLDADHESLEHTMEALEQVLSAGRWDQLYAQFAAFLGAYFAHIAEEERLQVTVLWPNTSDAELSEVFARFRRGRSVQDATRDLELMLPALSLGELTRIYDGLRRTASADSWQASFALAKRILPPSDMNQLEARLSVPAA